MSGQTSKKPLYLFLFFVSFIAVIIFLKNNNLADSFFQLFTHIPYYDKIGHFTLMGILAFLAVLSFVPLLPYDRLKSTSIVIGIVVTAIAIEECSQMFVASRTFSLADFIFDLLGVGIFSIIAYGLARKDV